MSRLEIIMPLILLPTPGLVAQETTARLEPDHAYIWVSRDAPEAAVLRELGITQWPDTADVGEGTAWTGFQFENFYLELTWVTDQQRFEETWLSYHPLHQERANWRTTGASPFALAFHRVDPGVHLLPAPFQVEEWWDELGGYVSDAGSEMPFLMVMGPRYAMPDPIWMTPELRGLADHPAGMRRLTSWTLGIPRPLDHEALELLVEHGALRVRPSSEHVLELTFDEGRQGKTFDARPTLPLVIHY